MEEEIIERKERMANKNKVKYLIVVDMQEDFVFGKLGSKEAQQIVPKVVEKVKNFEGVVIFTQDTHNENYLQTQEGKNLPVEHCQKGSKGWQLIKELDNIQKEKQWKIYEKGTFGSLLLAQELCKEAEQQKIESIELIGVCTDICVVSNALLLKAYLPEIPFFVDAACCAGVTEEKHKAALEVMESCQIKVS